MKQDAKLGKMTMSFKDIGGRTIIEHRDCGRVQALIVPWSHLDSAKHELMSDSPWLNFMIFRLFLPIAAEPFWQIAQINIAVAFLQARGFNREVFVKPPKEEQRCTNLWRLTAAAYSLEDSSRRRYLRPCAAITTVFRFTRSIYESTLYYIHFAA